MIYILVVYHHRLAEAELPDRSVDRIHCPVDDPGVLVVGFDVGQLPFFDFHLKLSNWRQKNQRTILRLSDALSHAPTHVVTLPPSLSAHLLLHIDAAERPKTRQAVVITK
jgi:hypothetical protein